ncbi:ABC multidrug transporter [Tirmania nivea]|nr:ABC multidrug transporter [Tirmania nivea]
MSRSGPAEKLHTPRPGSRSASLDSTDTDYSSIAHIDLDKFLKTENAQRESKGVPLRRLGVRFKGVTTWGAAAEEAEKVKTFARALKRTLLGRDLYEWLIQPWFRKGRLYQVPKRALIRDVSGLVRDGEMMLVLGCPGSGCTTFLRTITSNHSSYLSVDGRITYSGGLTPRDIQTRYRGDVTYMPEEDLHLPYLTVRQTLDFAFRCKQPDSRLVEKYISTLARVFGISHVLDTVVGNEHIRGISGGERKRLSCIETLATDAVVVAWDGSTRGLDAAATLDYARSLRILTDVGRKATIVSLYQVSEEVWELMDKVTLLTEGRVIFSGLICEAKTYFVEELGYECGERRTTADFLTSVTNPGERRFRPGWEAKAPKGAAELEKAFRESRHYKALMQEVDAAGREFGDDDSTHDYGGVQASPERVAGTALSDFRTATLAQKAKYVRQQSSYTISFPMQVLVCIRRQWLYLQNNVSALVIRIVNTIANALVMGSLFWAQPATSDGAFSRSGFIFYTAIFLGWIQLAELEEALAGRGVVERHRNFAFVRPSAVSVARMILDLPTVLIQAAIFVSIVYWMAGMKATGEAFMTFFVFVYLITIELTALYRTFAAISSSYEVAIRYCGLTILVYIIFGGYMLSVNTMMRDAPWFGWLAYINPVHYTFAALMAMEFYNLPLKCTGSSLIPSGPGYNDPRYQTCALAGSIPSQLTVPGDNYVRQTFGIRHSQVWINFLAVLAMTLGLYVAGTVASEWFQWGGTTAEALVFRKGGRKGKNEGDVECQMGDTGVATAGDAESSPPTGEQTSVQLQKSTATFTWKDLNYTIPSKAGEKKLLNNVEGICRPGEMTALIGASGAGKTTLLSVLSHRVSIGTVTGSMLINGLPLPSDFDRSTGLCEQMDLHDPSSTIYEAFTFSALLRQDSSIPHSEKLAYVDTVLQMLGLTHLSDALIGSLALEQKKRTTIGVELCARPKLLLFLDEPTSGLDSQGAYNIVKLLRRLADEGGQSVLCTIHQASQQILEIFDGVLALNPGGNTFYCGPVGEGAGEIIRYFEKRGVCVKEGKNVADLVIEVGRGLANSNSNKEGCCGEESEADAATDWSTIWRNSLERQSLLQAMNSSTSPPHSTISKTLASQITTSPDYATSTPTQTIHLIHRLNLQFWRTPEYPYSRLFASFLHALLNGFTFFHLGHTLADLQSRAFSTFLVLMIVPEFVNAVAFRFSLNTALFRSRELPARIYSPLSFALANILSELPYIVLNTLVFYLLWYFPVGFPTTPGAAGYMFLMLLTFHTYSTSWGQWIAALAPDYTIAANLVPFFIIMCESFNGILRPWSQLEGFWKYGMYMVNPMTYFVRGTLAATMSGTLVQCTRAELNIFQSPPGMTCKQYVAEWFASGIVPGYIVDLAEEGCGYCKYKIADEYLRTLNVNGNKKWRDWGVFAGFAVVNWILVGMFMCGGRGEGVWGMVRRVKGWWRRRWEKGGSRHLQKIRA